MLLFKFLLITLLLPWGATELYAQSPSSAETEYVAQESGASPSVYIDINQGMGRKYKIAIPDLLPLNGGSGENVAALPTRLAANLNMTGLFTNLDKRSYLEPNPRAGVDPETAPDYTAWSHIGADFLVKGGFSGSGSKLTLEMRLFDVGLGRQMLGKRYTGSSKEGRQMINQFTNDLLAAITGTPGVFGSQIIFASGAPASKVIMMTELGSDDAEKIGSIKGGPSTQPTMGFGGTTSWIRRNDKKWELLVDGKVVASDVLILSPAFRPDGTVAAAVSGPTSTGIFSFNGRSRQPLTNDGGINVSPTFSPDGSRMAYVSDRSGSVGVYVTSANGAGGGVRISGAGKATDPAWSPTGEYIAFVTRETDICIVRPDGTGLRQLTGGQGANMRPSFSPDGRMIVFDSTRNGRKQLFVMAVNGDSQQPLMPSYNPPQEQAYWSPTMPTE